MLHNRERQVGLDQVHRFLRRCAFGQDLLITPDPTNRLSYNYNYWQGMLSQDDDLRVVGYACVGKKGLRSTAWRPEANWARAVLHSSNLQTEWSELPDNARREAGRLAGVARMPFGAAGIANAITALAALPRTF